MKNSGIYCLYFEELEGKYYIGFASNLSNRYSKHCSLLSYDNHPNYLLQKYYKKYGNPIFNIIEYCEVNKLPEREIYWIEEFNSFGYGFNLTKGGESVGFGEDHPSSLYSNEVYEKVFIELVTTNKPINIIAREFNVSKVVLYGISDGSCHTYLSDKYPELYAQLMLKLNNRVSGKSSAKDKGIIYPLLVSPTGTIETVDNTHKFARDNNLDQAALHRLLTFKANSHKGWKRYEC